MIRSKTAIEISIVSFEPSPPPPFTEFDDRLSTMLLCYGTIFDGHAIDIQSFKNSLLYVCVLCIARSHPLKRRKFNICKYKRRENAKGSCVCLTLFLER